MVFLEISLYSQENTFVRVSFLINLKAKACNFIEKGTVGQIFSCEFWEISKNAFFTERLRVTASVTSWDRTALAISQR